MAHLLQFENPITAIVTESNRLQNNLHISMWIDKLNCFVAVETSHWNERQISI